MSGFGMFSWFSYLCISRAYPLNLTSQRSAWRECLTRYGDRLFSVHLNDNCGDDDTHLLPYDGNIEWDTIRQKLKKCKNIRYLTLEVDFNRNHEKGLLYQGLSAEEFLALAYKRILLLK